LKYGGDKGIFFTICMQNKARREKFA